MRRFITVTIVAAAVAVAVSGVVSAQARGPVHDHGPGAQGQKHMQGKGQEQGKKNGHEKKLTKGSKPGYGRTHKHPNYKRGHGQGRGPKDKPGKPTPTVTSTPLPAPTPTPALPPPPPVLGWAPQTSSGEFDFGMLDAMAGGSAEQAFALTNSGGSPTGSLAVTLGGSGAFEVASDGCSGQDLGPGASCAVTVRYAPAWPDETHVATLYVGGGVAGVDAAVTLRGASAPAGPPNSNLSPGTFLAGPDPKRYQLILPVGDATQTFTVTNSGAGPTNVLSVAGGEPPRFVVADDTCSGSRLRPGQSCTFGVTFTRPSGCAPGSVFGATFDIVDPGNPTLRVTVFGRC
ncbi:MAG TPA: choice-of-anchor D domain-containing protein [Dehalococcoidia bacterium]|nr:choice-of-anchor D domain-containing protein [Dehalococcoidia bacterium]